MLFVMIGMMAALVTLLFDTTTGVFRTTAMVFSEAKLSIVERPKPYSRRLEYCDTNFFAKMRKKRILRCLNYVY